MKETVKIIPIEEAIKILQSFEKGGYSPKGKFIAKAAFLQWTAIDNSTGDAWERTFHRKHHAIRWLKGYETDKGKAR